MKSKDDISKGLAKVSVFAAALGLVAVYAATLYNVLKFVSGKDKEEEKDKEEDETEKDDSDI